MANNLMELLQKKKQQIDAGKRAKTVSLPENSSRWRILPGWSKDDATFWHDFGRHFIKDSTGKIKAVYMCVDKTYGKPCSVCTAIETAINNNDDPEAKELLEGARSSKRILLNALHLDGPNPTVPVVLEVPPTVFEQIVTIAEEWDGRPISVEKDALDLIVERAGKGKLTKYSVQPASKAAKVDPAVMEKVTNLAEYVAQEDEEAANRALTSIASVAGLLPAPASSAVARPALPRVAELREYVIEDVDDTKDADDEALKKLEEETTNPVEVKVEKKSAPASTVATSTSPLTEDEDINSLLAMLQ